MSELEVKYFGQLAEVCGKGSEAFSLDSIRDLKDLKRILFEKYPTMEKHLFKIAVDHSFEEDSYRVTGTEEIALLPPFAGG